MRGWRPAAACFLALLRVGCGSVDAISAPARVLLATTTSVANSGLLDALLPAFEEDTGVHVDFLAVGTGVALKYGENGDVDAVLTHDPEAEAAFVRKGFGVSRIPILQSDFVLLGPSSDPASVKGSSTVTEAFRRIAAREVTFISRGDSSGTHMREREIWKGAGIEPRGSWYLEIGQGMGICLVMASERAAYTLADRGSYLSRRDALRISILFEGDPALVNTYSIIAVPPGRRPQGNSEGANRLIGWLVTPEGQACIGAYQIDGFPPFLPLIDSTQAGVMRMPAARPERGLWGF